MPHSSEIRNQKIANFVKSLYGQDIDQQAYEIMAILKEEMELSTIAFKLISMLKDQVEVRGKAQIGKSEKELEFLMSRPRYERRDYRRHGANRGGNRYKYKGGQGRQKRRDGDSYQRGSQAGYSGQRTDLSRRKRWD